MTPLITAFVHKITFKRTRIRSNAVCFTHNSNVCACAVSASILHLVANLSPQIDSATAISYMTRKRHPSDAALCLFWRFLTAHAQFRQHFYFRFKILHHI